MTPLDSEPALRVIMYHYVRELSRSPFPQLKAMLLDDFRGQLTGLRERYEMATLESATAFLNGAYRPARDLCLLTFDDGLKEHYRDVTPLLAECRVQGLFFVISGCVEEQRLAPVHMNHFLMAALGFQSYRSSFLREAARERARPAFNRWLRGRAGLLSLGFPGSRLLQIPVQFRARPHPPR